MYKKLVSRAHPSGGGAGWQVMDADKKENLLSVEGTAHSRDQTRLKFHCCFISRRVSPLGFIRCCITYTGVSVTLICSVTEQPIIGMLRPP